MAPRFAGRLFHKAGAPVLPWHKTGCSYVKPLPSGYFGTIQYYSIQACQNEYICELLMKCLNLQCLP